MKFLKASFYISNLILFIFYLYPGSIFGCFLYNDCNQQPQIASDYIVSSNHLYSFILVSIVGFLTFKKSSHFVLISIYLIFLSIILEFLHFLIPNRLFEFKDLFGNLVGVSLIIIIFYFFKKYEIFKN